MSTEENILVLQKQLNELHAKIQIEWIEKQLIECPNDGVEQLYQKWIEQDWTLQKRFILPSLSVDLDSKLLNGEKKIIHGDFLLQINDLIDISKSLLCDQNDDEDGDGKEDGDKENNESFFKNHKNNLNRAEKEKKIFQKGPRMLYLRLFDGHNVFDAIEYSPIPQLNEHMIGNKILLSGPINVYMGLIHLKSSNLKIISLKTFNIVHDETVKNNQNFNEMLSDEILIDSD
ncbi:putative ribosomal protein [Sarcoptes scabiei]|nr:putative ribosomal protein [Sarcoptes scabiei]